MNNNNFNTYKYYGNYDKNIKAIRGGGVITPSNPPNRLSTTDTIKKTWYPGLEIIPPMNKTVYYSDSNLTNGYLDPNDKNNYDNNISDYYYASQQSNLKYSNSKNKFPLNFPPPLINSKPKSDEKTKSKSDEKKTKSKSDEKNKSIKSINQQKQKNLKKNNKNINTKKNNPIKKNSLSMNDIELINYIQNNCLYDGKYIYTIENNNLNYPDNKQYYIETIIPMLNYKNYYKNNFTNKTFNPISDYNIENDGILEYKENFYNTESISNSDQEDKFNYNILLFVILIVLLIFYFYNFNQ